MYNTQFKVKYNEIKEELTWKLKNKTSEELQNNPDPEYEYTSQDVLDICNKLYRDELLSVFGLDNLDDEKIVYGMKYIYDIMMTNEKFKEIINDTEEVIFQEFIKNGEINNDEQQKNDEKNKEKKESIRQIILISLFSEHIFYIFHKCICQQIELGIIDNELLVELRKHSADLFKDQNGI